MSDQLHQCDPKARAKQTRMFLCYGALSIALAVGFGYSMASVKYQGTFAQVAELAAKERTALHSRYMRQMNAKDKEIAELRAAIMTKDAK